MIRVKSTVASVQYKIDIMGLGKYIIQMQNIKLWQLKSSLFQSLNSIHVKTLPPSGGPLFSTLGTCNDNDVLFLRKFQQQFTEIFSYVEGKLTY